MTKTNSWSIRALYLMMALLLALSLSPLAVVQAEAAPDEAVETIERTISLSPSWGPPGANVTVTGEGFPPNTEGILFALPRGAAIRGSVDGVEVDPASLPDYFFTPVPFVTDRGGRMPATNVTVDGTKAIVGANATFWVSVCSNMASAEFIVRAPVLTVYPDEAPRGTRVSITGEYFDAGLLGYIYAENPHHPGDRVINPVAFLASDDFGRFDVKGTILMGAPICDATFRAVLYTGAPPLATDTFSVIPFDFALAVSPTAYTVTQGYDTTVTIASTLEAGVPGVINITHTAAPYGVTITIYPPSGTPPFASTMTIAANTTAAPGAHPINITGIPDGYDKPVRTATFSLTVIVPPPPVIPPAFEFALSVDPPSAVEYWSNDVTATVTVEHAAGPTERVDLSAVVPTNVTGVPLPPGAVTVTFDPSFGTPDFTSAMTISINRTTFPADLICTPIPINITGVGVGRVATDYVVFYLRVTNFNFSLVADPERGTLYQGAMGGLATIDVTDTSVIELPDPGRRVTLTYYIDPQLNPGINVTGLTIRFTPFYGYPAPVPPPLHSLMGVVATYVALPTDTDIVITIIGTSCRCELVRTDHFTLRIKPVPFDFTMSVYPTEDTIPQGGTTAPVITVDHTAGPAVPVSLTYALPADTHGIDVTIAPVSGTGDFSPTMTITASSVALPVDTVIPINITAAGGGLERTATFNLTVTPLPFDFSMTLAPDAAAIGQGESTTAIVTTTFKAGVVEEVTIAAAAPAGITVNIDPSVVTPVVAPGLDSTMTITAALYAEVGKHRIIVTATSAGTVVETASFTLSVTMRAFPIELKEGWNLISLPLIPEDSRIEVVLADILADVISVHHFCAYADYHGLPAWKFFSPGIGGSLTDMIDGKGYWIYMKAAATLTVIGTEMPDGAAVMPPAYDLKVGWNHIGFKSVTPMLVETYLGETVMDTVERMWGFDARTDIWFPIDRGEYLQPGMGYWIAVSAPGTIFPAGEEDLE